MRLRPLAAVSTVAVSMLLLAGCSQSPEPEPTTNAADDLCGAIAAPGEVSDSVTVDGDPGTPSTMTFDAPLEFDQAQVTVLDEGDGEAAETGDFVSVAFSVYDAASGDEITTIGYEEGEVLPMQIAPEGALGIMLGCATPGQRVVAALPATESIEAEVYVLDVLDIVPTFATGEPQDVPEGMPEVTVADDGTPSVSVGDTETPAETQVATVKKGDGYTVEDGDGVLIQYLGVRLSDGEEFDSTWSKGGVPYPAQTTGFVEGFQKALVGQTVGSQVLAVIPPAEAYGEEGDHELAGETLVFVVDIIGAQRAAPAPAE